MTTAETLQVIHDRLNVAEDMMREPQCDSTTCKCYEATKRGRDEFYRALYDLQTVVRQLQTVTP